MGSDMKLVVSVASAEKKQRQNPKHGKVLNIFRLQAIENNYG
jgi:hypothetical protein